MPEDIKQHDISAFRGTASVVATGTYDGVHLGHLALIEKVKEISRLRGIPSVLFTFWPHPRMVLKAHHMPLKLLNTREEKIRLLEATGVDYVFVYPFTEEFSRLSAEVFIRDILIRSLHMQVLVVGENHRMGNANSGNRSVLKQLSKDCSFEIETVSLSGGAHTISSTLIRKTLLAGEVHDAESLLGYPYFLTGEVIPGQQIGRTLGFPTANLRLPSSDKLLPGNGVYAIQAETGGRQYDGMLNIGRRPTIQPASFGTSIEVHLFDFSDNIYGKPITVYFRERLRDEISFEGMDLLRDQLVRDQEQTRALLKSRPPLDQISNRWIRQH
ncbi:MAG: bifunctional riboflavin kinase/FAD synthetase [Bacteroidales bacterium]|nr:bifunctional riboflavin kinase/FAD synthetase [Bacteroidales bacterium]